MTSSRNGLSGRHDACRVHTVFKVGDRVLLRTKELLDAADIGKLRPRWDGPSGFTVTVLYTLALPRRMRCRPTVNMRCSPRRAGRREALPLPRPLPRPAMPGRTAVAARRRAAAAAATSCRHTAGGRSGRLPAADPRRGSDGPRLTVLYSWPGDGWAQVRGTLVLHNIV